MEQSIIVKNIEKCLDTISSTTNWIIGSIIVIAFSQNSAKIFGFDVDKAYIGPALFTFLIGLNFYLYKLSCNMFNYYDKANNSERVEARDIMESHLWICNPFSKTGKTASSFIDDIGFALFTILWWLGFSLAFKLSSPSENPSNFWIITVLLSSLYCTFGAVTGLLYFRRNKKDFKNGQRKIYTWLALTIGIILVFIMNIKTVRHLF